MPIAVTLWYMSMDITSMFYGKDFDWQMRMLVSLYAGLLMVITAFWLDVKLHKKADFAFWLYLFGVIAFWCGLSSLESKDELSKFFYFCINLVMIGIGVLLARRVFVIFGAIGICGYLAYIARSVFHNDWAFPIVLTAIGLAIIYLGMLWQKNEKVLTQKVRVFLPKSLQALLNAKD